MATACMQEPALPELRALLPPAQMIHLPMPLGNTEAAVAAAANSGAAADSQHQQGDGGGAVEDLTARLRALNLVPGS